MSDTTKRDAVCQEFGAWYRGEIPEEVHWKSAEAMADEIVRLRGELRDTHTKVFHLGEKLSAVERERDQLTSLPAERILARVRAVAENELRFVDAQPILRALEGDA